MSGAARPTSKTARGSSPAVTEIAERGEGELERERRATARLGLDAHAPTHPAHDLAGDVEAEPRTAHPAGEVRVDAEELLEDPLVLGGRDSEPAIADGEAGVSVLGLDLQLDSPAAR